MDGLDLLKRVKTNPLTQKIPVFLISNLTYDFIVKGAKDLGAERYFITCDLSPDQIVNEIDEIMSKNYQSRIIRSPKDIVVTRDLQAIFDRLNKEYEQTN